MCYSAEVISDWHRYERLGGSLVLNAFVKLFWARNKAGDWLKVVPKGMRDSFMDPHNVGEQSAKDAALAAYRNVARILELEIAEQTERLTKAETVLASPKPTKKAANEQRIASNKIAAAKAKLDELGTAAKSDGFDRIWPGHYAPVLIRDPATGERQIVPMRYRCRLPGWTRATEAEKPGSYNARRDKLSTVWRQLFGKNHGVVVANRFYESVSLHRLQQRELVPGERDVSVEIVFEPEPRQELFLACLWRYAEATDDESDFYSFAAITRDPPPEVEAAGHDRCIIAIKPENLDAWLDPEPGKLAEQCAILDDPVGAYYQHRLTK